MKINAQQQLQEVDNQVQALFAKSAAFQELSAAERARIQANTSEILNTMAQNKLSQAQQAPGLSKVADPYALPLVTNPLQPVVPGTQQSGQKPTFTGGVQPGAQNTF
jgi:hypothetical protein